MTLRTTRSVRLRLLALLLALVLVAAACGNDDSGAGDGDAKESDKNDEKVEEGTVHLNALYFVIEPDGKAGGGFSPV